MEIFSSLVTGRPPIVSSAGQMYSIVNQKTICRRERMIYIFIVKINIPILVPDKSNRTARDFLYHTAFPPH